MHAALLLEPGHLKVLTLPDPVCPPVGVIVEVAACGICSSDVKMVKKGHRALSYPRVLGHEITGVVTESRSCDIKTGLRVQVAPGLCCRSCRQCLTGFDNRCLSREIFGFTRDGGFAQYVAVPLEGPLFGTLTPLSDCLTFKDAVLAEPLACCVNAQEKINISFPDTVLIFGGGTLGLLNCMVAKSRGAETVIIAEPKEVRRRFALDFGADHALDPLDEDFCRHLNAITDHHGVDAVIFATSQECFDQRTFQVLSRGARISIFSGAAADSAPWLNPNLIHYKEIQISGAYGCAARHNKEAMLLLERNKMPFRALLADEVTLQDIEIGMELSSKEDIIKVVITDFH